MGHSHLALLTAIVVGTAAYLCRKLIRTSEQRKYPPGPPRKFLIGNLLDIPRTLDTSVFASWKERYGDLVYLDSLGYSILILNSADVIRDLLDKRGQIYSHRPRFVMAELLGVNQSLSLMNNEPEYRQLRKLTQRVLSPAAVRKYRPMQEAEVVHYLKSLLREPEQFAENFRFSLTRIIMSFTYGLSLDDPESEYVTDAESAMAIIKKATVPGAYLVDFIPALRHLPSWFPFASFIRQAEDGRSHIEQFVSRPFNYVKEKMATGNTPPSFVADLLSDHSLFGGDDPPALENGIKWAAGTMYAAGQETTHATLLTFILLMAAHPDIQLNAQNEIDRVIGGKRLVTIDDKQQLPYVSAVIQEMMRWHVVVPFGLARRTAEDDEYRGYHIPAGTIVIPNAWALSQMDTFDAPTNFNPERFLHGQPPTDPGEYVFGFGRRICPGKYLADTTIFLFLANVLAKFNIGTPTEIVPGSKSPHDKAFVAEIVSPPEKFQCSISPRHAGLDDLLNQWSIQHEAWANLDKADKATS